MEITSWLTDVYGPRVTISRFSKAGDWAVKEMTAWGLANVKLEPFGPFGRGWSNDKFYAMATTPGGSFPLIGMSTGLDCPAPTGWSRATRSSPSSRRLKTSPKFTGQAQGQVVLTLAARDVLPLWSRTGHALHGRSS